jgi:uncharacterized protein YjdB
MLTAKRKLLLLTVLTLLMSLGWAGCRGFFVKPTLTSISVTPNPLNLQVGDTFQLTATGVYDDNSRKNLTGSSIWNSADPAHVSVNSTGLVTGVANTTTGISITAFNGTVQGSTSVTVGASTGTITITPTGPFTNGGSQQFTATLNSTDVTSSATWTSNNTSIVTFSTTTAGLAQFVGTGTTTITATTTSPAGSGSLQITVQ